MTTEHKYAAILRAIASGQAIERKSPVSQQWGTCSHDEALRHIYAETPHSALRVKPAIIRIGDVEVPEPMRVAPTPGVIYFPLYLGGGELVVGRESWYGDAVDHNYLQRGLCFATEEGAQAAAKAIIALLAPQGAPA
jgi:hypothetical protein